MSSDEAEEFMARMEKWDAKHARQDFIHRMERKLNRRERAGRRQF